MKQLIKELYTTCINIYNFFSALTVTSTHVSALVGEVVRTVGEPEAAALASQRLVGLTYPLVDGAGGGRPAHPRPVLIRGEDGWRGGKPSWKDGSGSQEKLKCKLTVHVQFPAMN